MKHEWTDLEFADWTLLPSEAALLANKTGPTRLGFAVLLKFFQYAARFPLSMQEVPTTAIAYIARQVGVPAEEFSRYDWEGRAVKYHRAQIRAFLGFREPTVQDAEELALWLSEHVLPQGHPENMSTRRPINAYAIWESSHRHQSALTAFSHRHSARSRNAFAPRQ
jgi:hypothetical protein